MANAEVYFKFRNQSDGIRGGGGWSFLADSTASSDGSSIIPVTEHAERKAWKRAWPLLLRRVRDLKDQFPSQHVQVKFWVDQQICPTCQKWLVIDVISHLKQIGFTAELYAEVRNTGQTQTVRIQRSTVWPVRVGKIAHYSNLPVRYS